MIIYVSSKTEVEKSTEEYDISTVQSTVSSSTELKAKSMLLKDIHQLNSFDKDNITAKVSEVDEFCTTRTGKK
jgi:hypothetical protein